MADEQTPAGGVASVQVPTAQAPSAQAPAATPEAKPPVAVAEVKLTSTQLAERLKESNASGQKALLKALGFDDETTAKAALEELKKLKDASLSDQERVNKELEDLRPKAQRGAQIEALFVSMVEQQFTKLPEATQEAIDSVANKDPQERWKFMQVLATAQPSGAPGMPPKPNPPASITPAPAPPPSGQLSKFQEWEQMRARSPMMGDIFYNNNRAAIEQSRPAQSA